MAYPVYNQVVTIHILILSVGTRVLLFLDLRAEQQDLLC